MKTVFRSLLAVAFALLLCLPAAAQSSEETLREIGRSLDSINRVLEQQSTPAPSTPKAEPGAVDRVAEYSEVGKSIGIGFAAAAKEIGIAVNDFAKTDVGMLTTFMIFWMLVGGNMAGSLFLALFTTVWFIVTICLWRHYYSRMCLVKQTVTTKSPDGNSVTEVEYFAPEEKGISETRFLMFLALIVACIPGFIMLGQVF